MPQLLDLQKICNLDEDLTTRLYDYFPGINWSNFKISKDHLDNITNEERNLIALLADFYEWKDIDGFVSLLEEHEETNNELSPGIATILLFVKRKC